MLNFYEQITKDYERSFIGIFAKEVLTNQLVEHPDLDLYFSISKFDKTLGYSLT